MARRIAISTLNASTVDIINTIRQNASYQYQSLVPVVEQSSDIPKVGEVLYGYPALANEFINALVTRIASVRIKSATFNNAYAELKKGYLEFGETVEEAFVQIAKAREFSAEKAESRELKRTLPDVKTAFHAMNWRVQYPITIQDEDLRTAFLDMNGVQDLIAKIVDSVTTANEYDEYLLFKYLMIKAITKGKMFPVAVDTTDIKNAGIKFRGTSNNLTFMNTKYNESGVHTTTNKDEQYIFMDSDFNAQYDVGVLASAFNMDKADFMGKLKLIDDWTTFDNDRFDVIRANSDMIEAVTDEELTLMGDVIAVLVDKEWFQVYDNMYKMTEKYVASGMYWNYFLNIWKTVSSSPFSNAVVFVKNSATITPPETITVDVTAKSTSDIATVLTVEAENFADTMGNSNLSYVQTQELTENGVGVHKYGAYMFPAEAQGGKIVVNLGGVEYSSSEDITPSAIVGDKFTLTAGETPPTPPEPQGRITDLGVKFDGDNRMFTSDTSLDVILQKNGDVVSLTFNNVAGDETVFSEPTFEMVAMSGDSVLDNFNIIPSSTSENITAMSFSNGRLSINFSNSPTFEETSIKLVVSKTGYENYILDLPVTIET